MSFSHFNLQPDILKALEVMGYTMPTPVQDQAIPLAMLGKDILASAQTGTGKTAAFLLPVLHRLLMNPAPRPIGSPRILILTPTRELARQILVAARDMSKFVRIHCLELVGGMPYRDQLRFLSKSVDIIVATPGRLMDHLERGRVHLSFVESLILDEADRMLDMGFLDDVQAIAKACGKERQTLLFTATLDRRMAKLAENLLHNPTRIAIEAKEVSAQIDQRVLYVDDMAHKRRILEHLAASQEMSKAIIFASTKRDADHLANDLASLGHPAAPLHGDMGQRDRNRTLERLRDGSIRYLVATDVAARGIDVSDISHVINFDMPRAVEDYVHRIGRTGRAGALGISLSFVSRADRVLFSKIQTFTRIKMVEMTIEGLEPRHGAQAAIPQVVKKIGKRPFSNSGKSFSSVKSRSGTATTHRQGPLSTSGTAKQGDFKPRRPAAGHNSSVTAWKGRADTRKDGARTQPLKIQSAGKR